MSCWLQEGPKNNIQFTPLICWGRSIYKAVPFFLTKKIFDGQTSGMRDPAASPSSPHFLGEVWRFDYICPTYCPGSVLNTTSGISVLRCLFHYHGENHGEFYKAKTPNISFLDTWSFSVCPEQDSNLHTVIGTTPSKWRVYQFHHLGVGSANIQSFS